MLPISPWRRTPLLKFSVAEAAAVDGDGDPAGAAGGPAEGGAGDASRPSGCRREGGLVGAAGAAGAAG